MALQNNGLSADAINAFEPQRMNNWTLDISVVPGDEDVGEQNIVLGLQSFQLPTETTQPIEIYYLNERRQYAGRTDYEGGNLTLTDWIDKGTAATINAWRRRVYNPETGAVGLKSQYATEALLNLYPPGYPGTVASSGVPQPTKTWRLINIWPMSVTWGDLDMTASEKIMINVQFVYDKAIFEVTGPASFA